MLTISALLEQAASMLQSVSSTPRLDAELLLSHASGWSKVQLVSRADDTVSAQLLDSFVGLLKRRHSFEPMAYITGKKEFWGLEFRVTPEVLIPRPETELVVERALKAAALFADPINLLDLGTGSGCIAIALAVELKKQHRRFKVAALDVSAAALAVARQNAAAHGVSAEVEFLESNWFSNLSIDDQNFHIIVSNPPYVSVDDPHLSPEIAFEPEGALFAGENGLDALTSLLPVASACVQKESIFISEIGSTQTDLISSHLLQTYGDNMIRFKIFKDLQGLDRVLEIRSIVFSDSQDW